MDDLDCRARAELQNTHDASARLRAMIKACLKVATIDREFWIVFMALWGESLHDLVLALINKNTYRRARKTIAKVIEQGVAEGKFKSVEVSQASATVLVLLDGISLQLTFEKNLMPLSAAERLCEGILVQYLTGSRKSDRT